MEGRRELYKAIRSRGIHVIENLADYYIVTNNRVMVMPAGNNVYLRFKNYKEATTDEERNAAKKKLETVINFYRDDLNQPWQGLEEFVQNLDFADYESLLQEYKVL